MFELIADALRALAAYPPVAAAAALVVIGGGVWLMVRGERDRKSGGNGSQLLPAWSLYGPAHEAMESIHNISEQGRESIRVLERIENLLAEILKEQREQRQTIEMIRNESRLR
jgi:hypothetical protein